MGTEAESYRRDMKKLQDKLEQTEAELRRFNIDRESHLSELAEKAKGKEQDMDKMELEINQLTTERDQLVRRLEKSQDMLLSFQQDLNITESELKHVANENRRLKDEAGASEKGVFESKEREIRTLSEKIRTMEIEFDDLLQKEGKEKIKADRAEREIIQLEQRLQDMDTELRKARLDGSHQSNAAVRDTTRFDIEIGRLTKERDITRTELEVCKHDLDRVEMDIKRLRDENDRLRRETVSTESKTRSDISRPDPEIEKGQREALESKNKEIDKLKDQL